MERMVNPSLQRQEGPSQISTVILLSGGIDSAACLQHYVQLGHAVSGYFVDYGQAARFMERRSAEQLAAYFGIRIDYAKITVGRGFGPGEIRGRNALLALTALMAIPESISIVAMGIHSGTTYFDCSDEFAQQISNLIRSYTDGTVEFDAPFLRWPKQAVFEYCIRNQVPIHLTYSCESGSDPGCGVCLSCKDREVLIAC